VYQLILFVVFLRYSRKYFKTYHNTLLRALYIHNQNPKSTDSHLMNLIIPSDPYWMQTSGYSILSNSYWRLRGNCDLHPAPSIETQINWSFSGNTLYLGVSYLHKQFIKRLTQLQTRRISGFCWRSAVAGLKQRPNFGFRINDNNAEMGPMSVKSHELGVIFQHRTEFIKQKWVIFKVLS